MYFVVKIPYDECVGVILNIFFDGTAKTLVIYREFWYFSRIFPTLFCSPPLCVVAFFSPPATRAGVLERLQIWVGHV